VKATLRGPKEGTISNQIREALAYAPDLKLWRNAQVTRGGVRGGLGPGSADLVGILLVRNHNAAWFTGPNGVGRFFALEVKKPREEPSDAQRAWLAEVRGMGGFAAVVTSPAEAMKALERARKGASE
jgi:hypothetical protein